MGFLDSEGLAYLWVKIKEYVGGRSGVAPNLLDNWYFADPVNQRRQTEYNNGWSYTIDRWIIPWGSAAALHDGYITINNSIDQKFEYLAPGIYTASVLLRDGTLRSGTIEYNGYFSGLYLTIPNVGLLLANGDFASFRICFADVMELVAAGFEAGTQQTLFRKVGDTWVLNGPPPDKGLELLKCQRYFQVFSDENLRPVNAVDFRPVMRINPALGTLEIDGTTYYTADAEL